MDGWGVEVGEDRGEECEGGGVQSCASVQGARKEERQRDEQDKMRTAAAAAAAMDGFTLGWRKADSTEGDR